jgi:hypothetical protein
MIDDKTLFVHLLVISVFVLKLLVLVSVFLFLISGNPNKYLIDERAEHSKVNCIVECWMQCAAAMGHQLSTKYT